ncbi:MAG: hypothetical protein ACK53L_23905, partial [Pirellulaceae bacterium]
MIQAPREVERLLEQAEEAIAGEEWTEATLALGMLLGIEEQPTADEFGQQDYFQAVDPGDELRSAFERHPHEDRQVDVDRQFQPFAIQSRVRAVAVSRPGDAGASGARLFGAKGVG